MTPEDYAGNLLQVCNDKFEEWLRENAPENIQAIFSVSIELTGIIRGKPTRDPALIVEAAIAALRSLGVNIWDIT